MKFDLKKLIGLLGKLRLCVKKQAVLVTEVTDDATDKKVEDIAAKIDDIIENTLAVIGAVEPAAPEPLAFKPAVLAPEPVAPEPVELERVKPVRILPPSPIPEQDETKE